jgi:hypothetical protein
MVRLISMSVPPHTFREELRHFPRKLAKYTMGKKSAAGDRPAATKNGYLIPLVYPDMPFATKQMANEEWVRLYPSYDYR